jgi:hypothetical protein
MRINLNARVTTVDEGLTVLRQAEEGAKDVSNKEYLKDLIKLCEASASAGQSTVYQLLIKVGISLE